jgi:hypothetical protein
MPQLPSSRGRKHISRTHARRRYKALYGRYQYVDPIKFAANPARSRDHRSMAPLQQSGGYLGPKPGEPLKAIFEGFMFLGGEPAFRRGSCSGRHQGGCGAPALGLPGSAACAGAAARRSRRCTLAPALHADVCAVLHTPASGPVPENATEEYRRCYSQAEYELLRRRSALLSNQSRAASAGEYDAAMSASAEVLRADNITRTLLSGRTWSSVELLKESAERSANGTSSTNGTNSTNSTNSTGGEPLEPQLTQIP